MTTEQLHPLMKTMAFGWKPENRNSLIRKWQESITTNQKLQRFNQSGGSRRVTWPWAGQRSDGRSGRQTDGWAVCSRAEVTWSNRMDPIRSETWLEWGHMIRNWPIRVEPGLASPRHHDPELRGQRSTRLVQGSSQSDVKTKFMKGSNDRKQKTFILKSKPSEK